MFRQLRINREVRAAFGDAGGTMRTLVSLAAPIAAAMAGETVMGLVDTKLVGGLGPAASRRRCGDDDRLFGYLTIFGLMRGVKVCVAHAVGEGLEHRTVRYAQAGIALGLTAGAAVWACTRDVTPLLRAIRVSPDLVPYASAFLAVFTVGAPASAVASALTHHRQALGDSRTPMVVGLGANVINAFLGWCLIYGHAGLPALGVRGGAMATVTAEVVEASKTGRCSSGGPAGRAATSGPARRSLCAEPCARSPSWECPRGCSSGARCSPSPRSRPSWAPWGPSRSPPTRSRWATIFVRPSCPGRPFSKRPACLSGRPWGAARSRRGRPHATRAALLLAVSFMTICGVLFWLGGGVLVRAFTDDPVCGCGRTPTAAHRCGLSGPGRR